MKIKELITILNRLAELHPEAEIFRGDSEYDMRPVENVNYGRIRDNKYCAEYAKESIDAVVIDGDLGFGIYKNITVEPSMERIAGYDIAVDYKLKSEREIKPIEMTQKFADYLKSRNELWHVYDIIEDKTYTSFGVEKVIINNDIMHYEIKTEPLHRETRQRLQELLREYRTIEMTQEFFDFLHKEKDMIDYIQLTKESEMMITFEGMHIVIKDMAIPYNKDYEFESEAIKILTEKYSEEFLKKTNRIEMTEEFYQFYRFHNCYPSIDAKSGRLSGVLGGVTQTDDRIYYRGVKVIIRKMEVPCHIYSWLCSSWERLELAQAIKKFKEYIEEKEKESKNV